MKASSVNQPNFGGMLFIIGTRHELVEVYRKFSGHVTKDLHLRVVNWEKPLIRTALGKDLYVSQGDAEKLSRIILPIKDSKVPSVIRNFYDQFVLPWVGSKMTDTMNASDVLKAIEAGQFDLKRLRTKPTLH